MRHTLLSNWRRPLLIQPMKLAHRWLAILAFAVMILPLCARAASFGEAMGKLREKQYAAAVELFQKSAREGNPDAFFMLGVMHQTGYGVQKSNRDAMLLYKHAALKGHSSAQEKLGILYASGAGIKHNSVLAYMWFEVAALNGKTLEKKPRAGLAGKMKQSDIELARKKAQLCLKTRYKTCE